MMLLVGAILIPSLVHAYRSSRKEACVAREVHTAVDAVSLLESPDSPFALAEMASTLVDHLYRHETRALLERICPLVKIKDGEPWEPQALAALQNWEKEDEAEELKASRGKVNENEDFQKKRGKTNCEELH
jgi:hypothetical protein